MDITLAQKAVSSALHADWKEAIHLNEQILHANCEDIDALNRIARAYAECGQIIKAKKYAHKTLKLDPANTIALKSLEKWKGLKQGVSLTSNQSDPNAYLEEPGKTKIISLICLGDKKLIAKLNCADPVKMAIHGHRVAVVTPENKYLGRLPDDLSAKLKRLMKLGYKYSVLIKSIELTEVKIFVRELERPCKHSANPSFTTERIEYVSFAPPELGSIKDIEPNPSDATDSDSQSSSTISD